MVRNASSASLPNTVAKKTIAIIGGLDADLIMIANRIPDRGESLLANEYMEALGGKGANSAIATYRACHVRPPEDDETESESSWESDQDTAAPPPVGSPPPATGHADAVQTKYDDDIQVKMIGAVGDDRYGDRFIEKLGSSGIDTSSIRVARNTQTSICFVMVDNYSRENRCLFTLGATATWKKEHFANPEDLGHGMRPDLVVAQMEIDKEVVETMIETAGKADIDFCLNAAPATPVSKRTYRYITHLVVNESEAAIMSGRELDEVHEESWPVIAQEFLGWGAKNIVITLGAKGSFYATATESGYCRAYDVPVVDTTGAGDTFTGTYASDYLRQKAELKWDIRSAVIRANKAAAITIQRLGAQQGIPWADEIDAFKAPLKNFDVTTSMSSLSLSTCVGEETDARE